MIHTDGPWFKDLHGRTLLLRGVNLGGSSKVPYKPDGATYIREGFFDHREVSFVGRPFPLKEADEHFARLKKWGLTFLRFLITWEAIEHAGPGIYDQEYLDYLHAVVEKAGEHGLSLFIDPHQDVWSRFSGGDGAPGWTLEAVGFDLTHFKETGAAIVHATHDGPFPQMIWPSNMTKLAAATMFTLFFGGNDFAPGTKIEGEPAQEYLQRHYINAIKQVAERLRGLPSVVGYDTLNEPLSGYISWEDLRQAKAQIMMDVIPSPYQSMLLAAGHPQELDVWRMRVSGPKIVGRRLVNPQGLSAWREGYDCVWKQNGVWEEGHDGEPKLLRPDYFTAVDGRAVDFNQDYYLPFANRYAEAIRSVDPEALIFIETEPMHPAPTWSAEDAENIVYAPHWYDGYVLFMKDFNPWLGVDMHTSGVLVGPGRIRKSFAAQLAHYKQQSAERLGNAPTLIGEVGIAYDLKKKRAYRNGDFSIHAKAFDRSLRALDDNLLSFTLWNYTTDNNNAHGDQWNDEDLSIFSRDQQDDPADIHSGGRALEAVVRPYAQAVAGEPLSMSFDLKRKRFEFSFRHDPEIGAPTEIYLPDYQYPQGCTVEVSDGSYEIDAEGQTLIYQHSSEQNEHHIQLTPKR